MSVRAGTGFRQSRRIIPPDNAARGTVRRGKAHWFGCAGRRGVGVEAAAKHAARIVPLMLAALVASIGRRVALVTDFGRSKRVGNGRRKGPARADGCENLHHQRDHKDREVSSKLPHPKNPFGSTNHQMNRKSSSSAPAPTCLPITFLLYSLRVTASGLPPLDCLLLLP